MKPKTVSMDVEMSRAAAASPAQALIIISARPDRSPTSWQVDYAFGCAGDSVVMGVVESIRHDLRRRLAESRRRTAREAGVVSLEARP